VEGDIRNAVIVSSTESNWEVVFMSERVEEGIAAGNSGFSDRCKCIWNTPQSRPPTKKIWTVLLTFEGQLVYSIFTYSAKRRAYTWLSYCFVILSPGP
jgi:hypothetical protein